MTDPNHTEQLWGTNCFTAITKQFDLRSGGQWLFTMHGQDGTDPHNDISFTKAVPPKLPEWRHGSSPIEAYLSAVKQK